MMVAQGHATARYTALTRQTWSVRLLTNSNKSLLDALLQLEFEFDAAYVDRLPDIPAPRGCACFFEDLHGSRDVEAYEARLRALAERHHGRAGRHCAKRFEQALGSDRAELKAFIYAAREEYRQAAADIRSSWRDLVRLHGRNATVYASGCLAIHFGVLPLTRAELLAAALTCARDHVAFVEEEVRRLGVPVSPARAHPPKNAAPIASGSVGRPSASIVAQTPFDRLKKSLVDQRKTGFVDLRVPSPERLKIAKPKGYIAQHGRSPEYWLTGAQFETIAGGKAKALDLKRELSQRGLLKTDRRGSGRSYVVKRAAPGFKRRLFVALRRPLQPKRPRGQGK